MAANTTIELTGEELGTIVEAVARLALRDLDVLLAELVNATDGWMAAGG